MFPSIHRPLKFGIPFREEGEASLPLGTTVGILYHIVATLNSDFETMLLWQDLFLFLSSGRANFDMLHFLHNPIVFFFFCFHLKTSFFRGSVGFIGLLGGSMPPRSISIKSSPFAILPLAEAPSRNLKVKFRGTAVSTASRQTPSRWLAEHRAGPRP